MVHGQTGNCIHDIMHTTLAHNRETGYYLRPRLQNVPLSDLTRQGYMYISSMLYISYSSLRSTLTLYCYQYSYFDVLSPSSIIDVTIMDVRLEMVY